MQSGCQPNVVLGEAFVHGDVLDPGGKALVEPEVGLPAHRDEIAEPHVGQLVCLCEGDLVLGQQH